jgi:Secretory lipase
MKMTSTLGSILCLLGLAECSSPPLPSSDPFYTPPSGYQSLSPGDIIQSRPVPFALDDLTNYTAAYQLMFRTTNALGDPEAAITTVIVPDNAQNDKLISYQVAEDAAWIGCAPSYELQVTDEDSTIQTLINAGWYVNVPDYEGPNSSFTAGIQAGQATLDSIRASLQSTSITGLQSDSVVSLWGYSGGSVATGWAAQLQPSYAPDLSSHFVGAAVGGFVVNISAVALNVNGGIDAGFVPAGIMGLASAYPEVGTLLNSYLTPLIGARIAEVEDQCLLADLLDFAYEDIFIYWTIGEGILYLPLVQQVVAQNTLGETPPTVPMYIYQGEEDEVVPYTIVDEVVSQYCAAGATIEYWKDPVETHLGEASVGAPFAFSWLNARMSGTPAAMGCATYTSEFSGTPTNVAKRAVQTQYTPPQARYVKP